MVFYQNIILWGLKIIIFNRTSCGGKEIFSDFRIFFFYGYAINIDNNCTTGTGKKCLITFKCLIQCSPFDGELMMRMLSTDRSIIQNSIVAYMRPFFFFFFFARDVLVLLNKNVLTINFFCHPPKKKKKYVCLNNNPKACHVY